MADVTTTFGAKDVGFASTVGKMKGTLEGFQGSIASFAVKAAALVGGFLAARSAAQAFNAAIQMGGQLNDLSARTGESAGNLAILQRAFQNAGAGAEDVGPTINRLQRAIVLAGEGSKQQAEAFGKLGLNLERLKDLTPTEQLQAVARALQGVENDSERTAIAMELLGRSGGALLPLLRAMGIELETARQQLGSTPAILDATNKHLDEIGDNFAAIGEKGKEFMLGLLQDLAPAIADITTRLANIDAAGFGAKLSEYVASTAQWVAETFKLGPALNQVETAIKAITSGDFGEGLSLMFMTARNTAFNAINEIVAAASAAVESVGGAVSNMFRKDGPLLHLLKTSFTIAGDYFKQGLLSGLADAMDALGPAFKAKAETLRYQAETAGRSIEMLIKGIGAQIDLVGEDAADTFASIPERFAKAYAENAANPLIEMRDRLAEAEEKAKGIADNIAKAGTAAGTVDPKVAGATETASERLARLNADARAKHAPRGGGEGSSRPFDPTTDYGRALQERGAQSVRFDPATSRLSSTGLAIERTKEQFSVDKLASGIRADLARLNEKMRQPLDRAQDFEDRGMFGAAERLRGRVDRRMAEKEKELAEKYGLNLKEQAKTPEERKAEEEAKRDKHAPKGGKSDLENVLNDIYGLLTTHMKSIDEKLPQHALAAG